MSFKPKPLGGRLPGCAVLSDSNSHVSACFNLIHLTPLQVNLPVNHCLLAPEGTTKENIKRVLSHPQVYPSPIRVSYLD